jgi:hypothetical protein
MVVVVLASLCLAAFRLHPSLGCFVTAVFCLAIIRTFGTIDRLGAIGSSMSLSKVIRTFIASVVVALTILVVSLLPGLCLMPVFSWTPMHQTPEFGFSSKMGIVISALIAITIASRLRRSLW